MKKIILLLCFLGIVNVAVAMCPNVDDAALFLDMRLLTGGNITDHAGYSHELTYTCTWNGPIQNPCPSFSEGLLPNVIILATTVFIKSFSCLPGPMGSFCRALFNSDPMQEVAKCALMFVDTSNSANPYSKLSPPIRHYKASLPEGVSGNCTNASRTDNGGILLNCSSGVHSLERGAFKECTTVYNSGLTAREYWKKYCS